MALAQYLVKNARSSVSVMEASTMATKKTSKKANSKPSAGISSRRLRSLPVNALLSLDVPTSALMTIATTHGGCPARVISVIQQWGGGVVKGGSDTLLQLSVNTPC